jgi:hypothetical protein
LFGYDKANDIITDAAVDYLTKNEKIELDLENASIKDIAPTVTKLLGAYPDDEWEGKSLLK